jgi:hypothetical protein
LTWMAAKSLGFPPPVVASNSPVAFNNLLEWWWRNECLWVRANEVLVYRHSTFYSPKRRTFPVWPNLDPISWR